MIAEKLFLKTLEKIRNGRLEIVAPSGTYSFGDDDSDLASTLIVHNPRFFSRAVFGGDDGAGDSFVDGDWTSADLISLVRIVVRNLEALSQGSRILSAASRAVYRLKHLFRDNSISGSRRNIAAHYDLSNEFFRLFLDPSMLYSCAIFESQDDSLEDAQRRKLDRICQKLDLSPADHVLEIGSGWGAFAEHAVRRYGCRVTTTTISREQFEACETRLSHLIASRRVNLLREDYRNLKGRFDKVVSIEMFEAVGLKHYDEFFRCCDGLLAPHGSMLLQTITMNEGRFPEYHRSSDWIQRRIFPGAELASVSEILRSLGRVTSMTVAHIEDIGVHYALTLEEWRRRCQDASADIQRLDLDERFLRMWNYYLSYCAGAFRERYIGDAQLLMTKFHNPQPVWGDPAPVAAAAGASRFSR